MAKIKWLKLENFKGYRNVSLDFTYPEKTYFGNFLNYRPLSLFYGPNGIGKSSILEAINLVSNPFLFKGRAKGDSAIYLRSLIYDNNYSPVADHVLTKEKNKLSISAVFDIDGEEKNVLLTNDGFEINELPEKHNGYAFYADSDNSSNLSKFQLTQEEAKSFVDLAEAIYGYKCDLDGEVTDEHVNEFTNETVKSLFYQDFILHKGSDKVHFTQMSAGEKKLATLLRQLCNPDNTKDRDILLIDEIDMSVYFKRHAKMLDKLREHFSGKQIIATTHSISMIQYAPSYCHFDLELYKPEYSMNNTNETPDIEPNDPNFIEEEFPEIILTEEDEEFLHNVNAGVSLQEKYNQPLGRRQWKPYERETPGPDDSWVTDHPGYNSEDPLLRNAILIDSDGDGNFRQFDPIKKEYKGPRDLRNSLDSLDDNSNDAKENS